MKLRPSSIVASLRRRNNVVLVHCYVTGHRRHVATETITRNNILHMKNRQDSDVERDQFRMLSYNSMICQILGSHGSEYEDDSFLGLLRMLG
jgi:hypothetical protein